MHPNFLIHTVIGGFVEKTRVNNVEFDGGYFMESNAKNRDLVKKILSISHRFWPFWMICGFSKSCHFEKTKQFGFVPFSQLFCIEKIFWRKVCASRTCGLSNDMLTFFISQI